MQNILHMCLYLSFLHLKSDLNYSSSSFVRVSWWRVTDKLATNRQNFARVGLQLKFAFRIRPSVSLTNYDVGTFCRNKSWKWTYVVLDLFFEEKNKKYGLACFLFFFFLCNFLLRINQIWKNVWESILSKVDSNFIPKPKETKFKLMQARTKNFEWIR